MRSNLEQLSNDQSIILMYLTDELSAADRTQVDKRLRIDDSFRHQFEQLRAAEEEVSQAITLLDQSQPLPGSSFSAQKKISRLMNQWRIDKMNRRQAPVEAASIFAKLAPAYPFIVAASLFVGLVVWWGLRDEGNLPAVATTQDLVGSSNDGDTTDASTTSPSANDDLDSASLAFYQAIAESHDALPVTYTEVDAGLNSVESNIQYVAALRGQNDRIDLGDQ